MPCEITLLGGFDVRLDGTAAPREAWRHQRARELVAFLALAHGRRAHREEVIELLWPALSAEAGAANLRKAVHYARAALGSAGAVETSGAMLALLPGEAVAVDAVRFEELAARGDARGLALYAGDLLPEERYTAWVEDHRERLRALRVRLLREAGDWRRLLAVEPSDEDAHRHLMRAALDAGDRAEAVRLFEQLRKRLRADLGVGPGQETIDLYHAAIARGTATAPSAEETTRGLLAQALVHLHSGEWLQSDRTARQARDLAIEAGLGREVGEASAILGIQANLRGVWKEMFQVEVLDSVQHGPALAAYVFDAHLCLAEYSLAGPSGHTIIGESALELRAVARRAGSAQGEALADLLLGEVALAGGRLAEAQRLLESAVARHTAVGAVAGQVMSLQRLAELAGLQGAIGRATALVRSALPLARGAWLEPHLVVRLHSVLVGSSRTASGALARVADAEDELSRRSVCPPCAVAFRVAEVKALARAGRLDSARRRLVDAERLAGMWPGGEWQAAAYEARGVVRRAEGNVPQARALLAEAAELFDAAGRPLDRDRCRAEAGTS